MREKDWLGVKTTFLGNARRFATHVSGTSKRNDHGCTHGDDERRERDRAELWCKLVKQSATPDMRRIGRTSVGRCKELGA